MSAEGKPHAKLTLLSASFDLMTRVVLRYPVATVAVAVALALLSLAFSAARLEFRTSRLDLMNAKDSHNQLWIEYINEFGDEDDVVVVVEGKNREAVVPVLGEVSTALGRESRLFHAVLHEVDLSKIRAKGLHYLKPEELTAIEGFLDKVEPIVHGQWARLTLGNMAAGMGAQLENSVPGGPGVAQAEFAQLSKSLLAVMNQQGQYESPWPEMSSSVASMSGLKSKYLLANKDQLGFVLLRLVKDKSNSKSSSLVQGSEGIDALRRLIAQVQVRHPEMKIGLTGLPIMENDEMRDTQTSMTVASLLSLLGVALLFIAGFGGLRHPLLAVLVLLLAMAWTMGYITLAVGHLNILSISFGVILIGLGIDFGIHYIARYLQLRRAGGGLDDVLLQTSRGIGPGVFTGAVTSAIAFFAIGLTEFTGVAELGIIAGGGVMLCCIAAMTVLPALIRMCDARRAGHVLPAPLDIFAGIAPLFRRPGTLLVATLALTAALSVGMGRLWYDHNLLNLQPEGTESVELERKLLNVSDQSAWFALSIAEDLQDLLQRKERFLQLGSVSRVDEIASSFPAKNGQTSPVIERIYRRLDNLPERPPRIPVDPPDNLGLALARTQALIANDPRMAQVQRQLEQFRDALRSMPLVEWYSRVDRYQQCMAGDLLSRLHALRSVANPEPPKLTDLPEGLVTRFVSQKGRYLLKIYAKGDIWDMDAMKKFVEDVRSVDPAATGNPLQTYEASRQMKQSYEQAAWYALAGVLLVVYIDMRSLRYTLLAILPLAVGMAQTFGTLGILDIPLNPANMIVLPLILGIGVDNGVHVVHDFRSQKGRYRMSASTATAVLLTSLTTMVGFGSLIIADHRGLQSLGRVLTIGVTCCLFASLIMLPALLMWLSRHRVEEEEATDQRPEDLCLHGDPSASRKTYRRDAAHDHPGTSTHAVRTPETRYDFSERDR